MALNATVTVGRVSDRSSLLIHVCRTFARGSVMSFWAHNFCESIAVLFASELPTAGRASNALCHLDKSFRRPQQQEDEYSP